MGLALVHPGKRDYDFFVDAAGIPKGPFSPRMIALVQMKDVRVLVEQGQIVHQGFHRPRREPEAKLSPAMVPDKPKLPVSFAALGGAEIG